MHDLIELFKWGFALYQVTNSRDHVIIIAFPLRYKLQWISRYKYSLLVKNPQNPSGREIKKTDKSMDKKSPNLLRDW